MAKKETPLKIARQVVGHYQTKCQAQALEIRALEEKIQGLRQLMERKNGRLEATHEILYDVLNAAKRAAVAHGECGRRELRAENQKPPGDQL